MSGVCDETCIGCRYAGKASGMLCCYYIFIADKMRGCEPGQGCTRREEKEPYRKKHDRIMDEAKAKKHMPLTAEEEAYRLHLWRDKKLSDAEIAELCGVTPSTITNWRRRRKYKANNEAPRKSQKGESNYHALLTREQVKEIRSIYVKRSPVFGIDALAKKYKVSSSTISAIVQGVSWRDADLC